MRAVIFIDGNKITYFGGGSNLPIDLFIPNTTIQDMEVLNRKELEKLITGFIQSHKIPPSELAICLTQSSYFQKDILPHIEFEKIQDLQNEFIESVPFDLVTAKYYNQITLSKIIAVNKQLIISATEIFKKMGFQVSVVVPIFALFPNPIPTISKAVAQEFLKNFKSLEEVTLPFTQNGEQQEEAVFKPKKTVKNENIGFKPKTKKKDSKRVYLLFLVFFLLVGVLGVVYARSQQKISAQKKESVVVPVETKPQETPAPMPAVASAQADEISKDSLVIEVSLSQDKKDKEALIVEKLKNIGFKNIITKNIPAQVFGESTLIFKNYISSNQRAEIIGVLESFEYKLTTLESKETTNDILIKIF